MSKKGSAWDKVFEQLQNPWDWAAASIGGAGGAVATFFLHGADLGHSIPAGALGLVGARKAFVASFRRRGLRRSAGHLREILKEHEADDMLAWLEDAHTKWRSRIISNEEFERRIRLIADEDSKRYSGIPLKLESSTSKKKSGRLPEPRSASPSKEMDVEDDKGEEDEDEEE